MAAPAHPCARGIPFILNIIEKGDRDIILVVPCRRADVSPPANRFLAYQGQAFPYAFAGPSADEIMVIPTDFVP